MEETSHTEAASVAEQERRTLVVVTTSDGAEAVTRAKAEPGAGKSKKSEEEGSGGGGVLLAAMEGDERQAKEDDDEKLRSEKLRKRERREERREWRRALQVKEAEYWDTLYDRGRRLVFGMGLPHDPLRGIQLLRRAAREARHLPARWELQCLMAFEPGEDTGKPVGMTDDPEAAASGDKDRGGGQTHSHAKKNKRGMKELEEEHDGEDEEEDEESEAKSMKSEKEEKKHRRRETGKDKADGAEEEEEEEQKKSKKQKKHKRKTKTNEKKTKKRKTNEQLRSEDSPPMSALSSWASVGVGSSSGGDRGEHHTEADRAQALGDANGDRPAAVDEEEEGEWGSDDNDDGEEEITEAEFREVIAAIQRVRLTTLQRLNEATTSAAARLGYGDVGDRTTGQRAYEMDWAKAVQTYKRYVSPLVVDIDTNGAPRARTRSADDQGLDKAKIKATKTKQAIVPWRGSIKIKPRWERIASYNLGLCYYNGQGTTQDVSVAAQLFQRAADMGHINGINSLGLCYYRGQGVTLNIDKALSLFKLAADRGYVIAQYNLANCLATGANGIYEQNLTTSACLYLRSACQGDVAAFAHLLSVTKNPLYFGRREVEFVVPTLFNQCLAKCWEEGLFGRHPWERNEGRRESGEPQAQAKLKKSKSKKTKKAKMKEERRSVEGACGMSHECNISEGREDGHANEAECNRDHTAESEPTTMTTTTTTTTTTKAKKHKVKDKRKGKRKEKNRDTRSRAKAKARRKIEAAEKASEASRDTLPQDVVARMYERRNTCVRPECEQQFWGKGRVVWKFPLYLRTSRSSTSVPPPSASASSSSSPTPTAVMTPTPASTALASASLLSMLSPATSPPGFGSVEEMIAQYLVYFEEEEEQRVEEGSNNSTATKGDARASSDAAAQAASDSSDNTAPRSDEPKQDTTPSSPPEGKVVWRKLILPFCSVHCSQVTTTASS